jgi:CRISPR-associated protein Cas5t
MGFSKPLPASGRGLERGQFIHSKLFKHPLRERIQLAFDYPERVKRFGCLFLGESDKLIKTIKIVAEDYLKGVRRWSIRDNRGKLTLRYWVDHVGSRNTRFLRYRIEEIPSSPPPDLAWTMIQSPS